MFEILSKELLGPDMVQMVLRAPNVSKTAEPGQFVIIRVYENGERIPLTIADFDRENGTITIVFQEIGKTTVLLGSKNVGDSLSDVAGPLGNPTEIENFGKVVCVGGGIGIAPIYPIARKLKGKENYVINIVGYRSKNYVFWEDKIRSVSDDLFISTNDGSYGEKGFVTDVLKHVMSEYKDVKRVITIGPPIMMKAVSDMTADNKIKTIASLNALMLCGMGMCGVCRVTINGETKFTCYDGPDFDAHLVDFEELMKRLSIYKDEEKFALEKMREEDR
ncbi:MAG: sulfide/dihydroorotate dehydrogenase-like FAD/NAD-binding protein [Candidatus Atribacteria bacterium]|nr:sulfide/dihydroorotate dehydrogenase-like FAD/NAD-binding protein [Candidatus Atribacteria bacterium]